jgi:hypothetical protein
MSTSDFVTIKIRGGLEANLPASAPDRELLIATDTNKLFVGKGAGIAPKQIGGGSTSHVTERVLYDDNYLVYADGVKGGLDPKGRQGWYFSNSVTGSKINWYYYDPTVMNTTVSDFKGTYSVVTIDTNRVPYFAVYTAGTDFGWYKSKRVYSVQNPSSVVPGKYLIYTGTNPSVYPELPRIQLAVDLSNTVLNKGAFGSTETIAYVTIHTASDVGAGNYQFVAHQLGLLTTAENIEFNLKTKSDTTKIVQIPAALSTWTINHNMAKRPSVTTIDSSGNVITGQVVYNSDHQITIYFTPAVAGTVYLN